jgi:hypothetical protein
MNAIAEFDIQTAKTQNFKAIAALNNIVILSSISCINLSHALCYSSVFLLATVYLNRQDRSRPRLELTR